MGWKQLVCLALIVHITISKAAVTKKASNSHLIKTTTVSSESVTDEYYYDDGPTEANGHSAGDLTSINDNSKSSIPTFDNVHIIDVDNVNDPNYSPGIPSQGSVNFPMNMDESKKNNQKTSVKNKYLSTTKQPSLPSMNMHLKNTKLNKTLSLKDNMDTTTETYEYDNDDNKKYMSTTKYQKPSTNKYLSAKATTTMTPLTKSKQKTKLNAQIASTSFSADVSGSVSMTPFNVHEKTIPSKKSSDFMGSVSSDTSNVMSTKTTNDFSNSMPGNRDASVSSDYSYYYEDDASTSPTTTKKQNDETSRSIFKPIGSFKSTIKISTLPTTKLPFSTPQRALSTQSEYYYEDNTLDNVASTTLPNKTVLFPQSKENFYEKSTSAKSSITPKPVTLSDSSISWHGNAKKTTTSHSSRKKPVSTEEDYLTDTNLEDESKEFSNYETGKHTFGDQPMNFPGNQFSAQGLPAQGIPGQSLFGKEYLQPLVAIQHNSNLGQFNLDNSRPGQFNPDNSMPSQNFNRGSNPHLSQPLNFPGPSISMDRQRPTFDSDSLYFSNKNDQGIRSSPFDDDLENLTTKQPVIITSKGKPSKKNNSKLDENHQTEIKVKPIVFSSKGTQSKDKNLDNAELQDSTENVNPNLKHGITSSSDSPSKVNEKLKLNPQSSSNERNNYDDNAFHPPGKNLLKTQEANNTLVGNSDNSNSLRSNSLSLCRTKSGFLKRNALVLNCKNETVQLQSAYQPWNSMQSSFKITLCSPESSYHDKKIIEAHQELEVNVNNFQCSKAKGTCVQRYTELVAMIHTNSGAVWDCIKIPLGCICNIPQ